MEFQGTFTRKPHIIFHGKIHGFPHISWENLWFPVKIFPTKTIHP